jgi:2-desacetyl-2-hydroxyethyl bacteriochlorophyllide A dehydrogenase
MPDALPSSMSAAVYRGKGALTVETIPVPAAGPGQVLVEVSYCGICGSDLHMVLEGWGQPGHIGGHETSGRVVTLGDGVTRWEVGDPVVIGPSPACGACDPCRAGRPALCSKRAGPTEDHSWQGAFATYVRRDEADLYRIPPNLPLRAAALTEPLAVALHGITLSGARPGERVLVTGAGPIGLLSIAALRALGIDDVTVSEPTERRRRVALAVGANAAVTPEELVTPDFPTHLVDAPYHAVLECSGHPAAMETGLGQLAPMGRLVLVGAGIKRPRFDNNRILLNELVITGAYTYDADGYERALELLSTGGLPVDLLIEPGEVPLEGLLEAMRGLAAGELAAKVMVVPGLSEVVH